MQNLQILGYVLKKIEFEVNDSAKTSKAFNIHPNVRFDMALKGDLCRLSIKVSISKTEQLDTPFNLDVTLVGDFKIIRPINIQEMTKEASETLYPYARSSISSLTTNANIPPYYLPFFDFDKITNSVSNSTDQIKIRPLDEEI